jgi:hypothetical protein
VGDQHLYDWFEVFEGGEPSYLSPGHERYNETYLTTLHEQRARQIILNHNRTRPLFLLLAAAAVHSPLQATPALLARVDAIRGSDYWRRCGWFDWGTQHNPTPLNPASPLPCAYRPHIPSRVDPRTRHWFCASCRVLPEPSLSRGWSSPARGRDDRGCGAPAVPSRVS